MGKDSEYLSFPQYFVENRDLPTMKERTCIIQYNLQAGAKIEDRRAGMSVPNIFYKLKKATNSR